MKIKVNDSLRGELYVSCLDICLKKGQTLEITNDQFSHHDISWAINKGYLSLIDGDIKKAMSGKVEIKNISKRSIILPIEDKLLSPGSSIFINSSELNKQGFIYLKEKNLIQIIGKEIDPPAVVNKKATLAPKQRKTIKKISKKEDSSEALFTEQNVSVIDDQEEVQENAVMKRITKRKKAEAKPYIPLNRELKENNSNVNNLPQNKEVILDAENK